MEPNTYIQPASLLEWCDDGTQGSSPFLSPACSPNSPNFYYEDELTLLRELEEFGKYGDGRKADSSPTSSPLPWTTDPILIHTSEDHLEESTINLELFTNPKPAFPTTTVLPEESIPLLAQNYNHEFQSILDALQGGGQFDLTQDSMDTSEESSSDSDGIQTSDLSEKILDALLDGDLEKAEAVASSSRAFDKNRKSTIKKPRLPPRTDKAARKKEQNKTAATRYREKKKLEASIVGKKEEELALVNSDLVHQRDELARELRIIKSLLRDVISVKRNAGRRKRV